MSELETLRRALRDDAERRYGRRHRARGALRALVATGAVAAALAAGWVVVTNDGGRSEVETVATPEAATPVPTVATPEPTVATPEASTPAPTVTVPTATPGPKSDASNPDARPAAAQLVADPGPTATSLLDPAHKVIRAWSVPDLHGHVLLTEKDGMQCLSMPDRLTNEPDAERGVTCGPHGRFGISLKVGNDYAAVVNPDAARPPMLKLPDGTKRTLKPDPDGLIVFVAVPAGSSISLYDAKGNRRTDGFELAAHVTDRVADAAVAHDDPLGGGGGGDERA